MPCGMGLDERERWHALCSSHGVSSCSGGLGPLRRISVSVSKGRGAGSSWRAGPSAEVMQRAAVLHDLLSDAHGGRSQLSLSELQEMLAEDAPIPDEVTRAERIRCAC